MIAKCKAIAHGGNALEYIFREGKLGRLLALHNLCGETPKEIHEEMKLIGGYNSRCKNKFLRIEIGIAPQDEQRMTFKTLNRLALLFAKQMGLDNHQWVAVTHKDTDNLHIHIIANRISLGGQVYDTTFVSNRAARVAEELSRKHELTIAKEVRSVLPYRKAQADPSRERTKQQVRNICYALLDRHRGKGLSGHSMFLYELFRSGVTIERMKNKQGTVYGMKFTYDGHSFKASEIGREFGFHTLPKQFEIGNAQKPIIQSSMIPTKDSALIAQVAGAAVDVALDTAGSLLSETGEVTTLQTHGTDYAEISWQRRLRNQAGKKKRGAGNMMLDVHLLPPSRPFPNRKPNRENCIKNACFSNSHSNIAPSNDKRPLFVQIPATSSASLVSTLLPIQCLRPTNFFFCRGIFLNSFLPNLLQYVPDVFRPPHQRIPTTSEPILIRSEPIRTTSERITIRFGRKISANIPLQKKKLVGRRHWIGNEVETSEVLGVAEICTNKGRLSFEAAMLL